MKVIHKEITVDGRNGVWALDVYGDTHLGSKSVDEELLAKHIKETQSTGNYWCHVGDAIDGIIPKDKRFDSSNLTDWAWDALREKRLIEAEWERFLEHFMPVADNGLFVLSGDGKHNVMDNVADCFGTALEYLNMNGGYPACHLVLSFKRGTSTETKQVELVFHHGWFSGRMKGGKANNLVNALSVYPNASGFFCGHGHDKTGVRVDSLVIEAFRQKQWVRRAAMTGAYLQTYANDTVGYGEVRGYAPAGLGRMTVVLRPFSTDPEKRIELYNM